ncbi:calnexin independence factor cif1 [Gigaspora margarita]|uniref:Calnexin independence factor cif1 n=1 Tax=Gigaspora margarita TaxID=4874 RepID=A0A8H3X0W7_GIGMA|nr:calnexin independence factor cif1 [Gigaspora margarita]
MEKLVIRRDVRHHLRSKWIDLKYAVNFQNNESQDILRTTSYISQKEKAYLIISAQGNLCSFKKLVKLRHLTVLDSNTASSHNIAHQECVNILLSNFGPLSTSVNEFVRKFYENLYEKLEKLVWGPFAPRPFGIFPMIAINYNTTSDYHWDKHDKPNSLCCLVALREFEGGELCFPQLQIGVPLQSGQVVAFSLRLLLHSNFLLKKDGIEKNADGHDVIFIKHQNLNNAQGLNSRTIFFKLKKRQITISPSSTNCRRGHISLVRTRHGLRAEDPFPDL